MTKRAQVFNGAVPATSVAQSISAASVTIEVLDGTSWPLTGPYVAVIDRGNAREEYVKIGSRIGNLLQVCGGLTGRGINGTTAQMHPGSVNTTIEHLVDAEWIQAIDKIFAGLTTKGDLLLSTGQIYTRMPVGQDTLPLCVDQDSPKGLAYKQVTADGITDATVTTTKVADGAITEGKMAGTLTPVARMGLRVDGGTEYQRRRFNFITGTGMTLAAADDSTDEEVDVTLTELARISEAVIYPTWDVAGLVGNTTAETTLITFTLPANEGAASVWLKVRQWISPYNDSGATRTLTLKLKSGSNVFFQTAALSVAVGGSGMWTWETEFYMSTTTTHFTSSHLRGGATSFSNPGPYMVAHGSDPLNHWNDAGLGVNLANATTFTVTATLSVSNPDFLVRHYGSTIVRLK